MASRLRPGFSLKAYLESAPRQPLPVDEHVKRAARLAAVKVDTTRFREDVRSMLQFASLLHKVDTAGVEPLEALVDEYHHLWEHEEPLTEIAEPAPTPTRYYELPPVMEERGGKD